MKEFLKVRLRNTTGDLFEALDGLEQSAQALRWRLANTPGDLSALGDEIGRLDGDSRRLVGRFGEHAALAAVLAELDPEQQEAPTSKLARSLIVDWDGIDCEDSTPVAEPGMAETKRQPEAAPAVPAHPDDEPPTEATWGRYRLVRGDAGFYDLEIRTPDGTKVRRWCETTHIHGLPRTREELEHSLRTQLYRLWLSGRRLEGTHAAAGTPPARSHRT